MGAVTLDADVIIGVLEPTDAQHSRAVAALQPWLAPENLLFVPASVYSEILVRPIQRDVVATVDAFIQDANIQVVAIDRAIARRAAELRAAHPALRLPDALAVATALRHGTELLTLDERLQRLLARVS